MYQTKFRVSNKHTQVCVPLGTKTFAMKFLMLNLQCFANNKILLKQFIPNRPDLNSLTSSRAAHAQMFTI
jgi:hypothetical protein